MRQLVSAADIIAFRNGRPLFAPFRFEVRRGEIAVIRGGNGLGKTTLLDCFAGRYFDWSGRLSCPRQSVSYLPQDPQHPTTVPLSQLAGLTIGYEKARYEHLLGLLNLTSEAEKLPSVLSGGELQKTRLLLAFLRKHDVLLLDEPFANIDDHCRTALYNELQRTRENRATVLVSHPVDTGNLTIEGGADFHLEPSID